MTNSRLLDTMQDLFVSKGGVVALINLLKESFGNKPAPEEIRVKIMTAIFHLTLYSGKLETSS